MFFGFKHIIYIIALVSSFKNVECFNINNLLNRRVFITNTLASNGLINLNANNKKIILLNDENDYNNDDNYMDSSLCVFGVTVNFINYKSNILGDNLFMTLYLNYLLFFNGSLFTFLTLESYFRLKYSIKKNSIIYSDKTNKSE